MAPSRGLASFRHSGLRFNIYSSRCHSTFPQVATDQARKTQVYVSRTLDPYLNLSIEHFLLQKSPPDSTILFLYTNRPCIVIGRNQNPWVEVNLGLLNSKPKVLGTPDIESISLVRRRSGGGTVFHDEGNVNYSVICPTAAFDRDKHAQMVVRALKQLGVTRAKVNERHDIILEPDNEHDQNSIEESTPISTIPARAARKPLKVSGSAYKLTRLRSLHHGTCLLSSPNIHQISQYLRSPAKSYIKARGVDSVSSPITNVNVSNEAFEKGVIAEFGRIYDNVEPFFLTDEASKIPEVAKGLSEMKVSDSIIEMIYLLRLLTSRAVFRMDIHANTSIYLFQP
jgi:lipoate-protein ligase A